jgi:hydroxyethylthiazole kinase-like uncharacterized protein yjeF
MENNPTLLPDRNPSGHKGTFGTLVVIGGHESKSDMMFGGTALAGIGALRTGIGKCIFAMPEDVLKEAIEIVPQAIGFPLIESSINDLKKLINESSNCVLIGPAFGVGEFQKMVIKNILECSVAKVIDADGLNILAKYPGIFDAKQTIITPQPAEFERLKEAYDINKDGDAGADQLALGLKSVVVLKNSRTYITDGKKNYIFDKPNPVLATAGSGDLLSGIIAGLVTQYYPGELSLLEIAKFGVEIHSASAELWAKKHGDRGALITEIANLIPHAIKTI